MILPTKREKPKKIDPTKIVIFSLPKVGKSSALSALDNNLIIDLEDGADYYDTMSVKASNVSELNEIATAIEEAGNPYKYITIDTITVLQDMVGDLAIYMYKQTPMGKSYKGSDILTLPNGAGYYYHRKAFDKIVDRFDSLCETLILVGHVKDKYIEKKPGEEIVASELDLIGKLKSITSAKSDAIGYMYRKDNQNILSFKTSDTIVCGARSEHLKNAEIVLSEMTDDGLITHWDQVFKQYQKQD